MIKTFKWYDADKGGTIDSQEFKKILVDLGHKDVTDEQTMEMLSKYDRNNDNVIEWKEFL